ncbi:hypothetical protein ZWY2020_045641 [Hordeum vulgare]|nr:hypothetical protein ZWY2020_045641 [Hordeum vulgare]
MSLVEEPKAAVVGLLWQLGHAGRDEERHAVPGGAAPARQRLDAEVEARGEAGRLAGDAVPELHRLLVENAAPCSSVCLVTEELNPAGGDPRVILLSEIFRAEGVVVVERDSGRMMDTEEQEERCSTGEQV